MPTHLTSCPRNCYSTCSMRVTVEDNRLVKIDAVPANLATPEGPCIKGLAYVERAHSDQRITRPLRRKPDGSYEEIPFDDAIATVAAALTKAKSEHGPQSVLYYASSGTKGLLNSVGLAFWRLFGGCTTTYGDLCWPAGLEATRLTLGDNTHNAPWDLEKSKLVILWGKNSAETNIHQMLHVDRALENGGKLVVIDPRRTETAERADLLVQIRPGTDGALALGIGHILVRDGLVDREFIDGHVKGFDEYAAMTADYTPDKVSEITEVPTATIDELAKLIGATRPCTISPGFGMQRFTNSGQAMRAMLALLAITGNIGKPGAGWAYANLQTAVFSAEKDPIDCYPPEAPDGVVRVSVSTARLGRDMLAQSDPPLRVAWVERGNPIPQNPDTNVVLEAFRKLDFRVVVEEFMTDTAREADIVLPAKNLFEQTDVIGAYWHPYLQIRQKVLEPPDDVHPETEIYRALGGALGIDQAALTATLPGPSDEALEAWLSAKLAPFDITLDDLREGPVLSPAYEEVAFASMTFPTPSGRIEIQSEEAKTRWGLDELPTYREPDEKPDKSGKYPLYFLTPNTKNRIHSQFGMLETIRRMAPEPHMSMHPKDARERSITEGDKARVFNDRGELTVPVRLDWGLKPGCVSITNGFWISEGAAVNMLSKGRETDMGYGAAFHDNAVEVERA